MAFSLSCQQLLLPNKRTERILELDLIPMYIIPMNIKISTRIVLTLVASGFLFYASNDGLSSGYFTLLRFVVCAVTTYLAYLAYEKSKESLWMWIFGFVAVLFNPFILVTLKRAQWEPIDLVTGIFLIVSLFLFKQKNSSTADIKPPIVHEEKRVEQVQRLGGRDRSEWFGAIVVFLWTLYEDRRILICDSETSPILLPILRVSGSERRPYSNEEIDRFFDSLPYELVRETIERDGSLLPIEKLTE